MKYNRFIDNRVIQACIRPQLPKLCGPTVISEIIQIMLKKTICPHEISKIIGLQLDNDDYKMGMGTKSVLKGITLVSKNTINCKIIDFSTYNNNKELVWKFIKETVKKQKDLLYLHEAGHHILICGFLEEPVITAENFKDGISCNYSIPFNCTCNSTINCTSNCTSNCTKKVGLQDKSEIKEILVLAEHNIKDPDKIINSMLKERDFKSVFDELLNNKDRLHLVHLSLKH